jgi:hypothetical protein
MISRSKGNIGNWTEPVNMGYPVNSVKDDIYMVSRGSAKNMLENVMLSSDRDAVLSRAICITENKTTQATERPCAFLRSFQTIEWCHCNHC